MPVVRLEIVSRVDYRVSPNGGVITVELESITDDPNTWRHKVLIPGQLQNGQAVLSRRQDVANGTYPVYCGILVAYGCSIDLVFDVNIYDDATNKRLFNATFTLPRYVHNKVQNLGTVQVNPQPGTVVLYLTVGSGGNVKIYFPDRTETKTPGEYTFSVGIGTWITLEAQPNTGYYFDGYYEAGTKIWSSAQFPICMLMNRNIEARFARSSSPPSGSYTLTYNVGPNGTLYIDDTPYRDTSGQKTYSSGATVSLRAVPDSGYQVNKFILDGTVLNLTNTTVTMNTNHSVDVSFIEAEKGGGGGGYDPSEIVKQMMEKMVPPMVAMMGMMMMMQMMAGMMQSMAGSMAAGF
jgi:hypothetical protein